jgi:hypothetical protein
MQFTIDQARNGLTKATTKELKRLQKTASGMRFLAYPELAGNLRYWLRPGNTTEKSNRKAKIVKGTIRTERIRRMSRNIKLTIQRGPTPPIWHLANQGTKNPSSARCIIARPRSVSSSISTANPNDIVWDTILDQATVGATTQF